MLTFRHDDGSALDERFQKAWFARQLERIASYAALDDRSRAAHEVSILHRAIEDGRIPEEGFENGAVWR